MALNFPIGEIRRHLTSWGCKIRDTDSGIVWENRWGQSEIEVKPLSATALDGSQLVGTVSFTHTFGPEIAGQLDAGKAAIWNQAASLSALMPLKEKGGFRLVSRATLYAGNEGAWSRIYAPLICTEAYMQPAAIIAGATAASVGPDYFGLSNGGAPPPYGDADFQSAQGVCQEHGLFATASERGLTVEFPWDRGAVSASAGLFGYAGADNAGNGKLSRMAGKTFLCQLQTGEAHPCLGRGLFCSLQVPVGFSDHGHLVQAVTAMNQWEADAADMVPLFGAWCIEPGTASPAFVMFLPNELCLQNMPTGVVTWMAHRALRALPVLAPWVAEDDA